MLMGGSPGIGVNVVPRNLMVDPRTSSVWTASGVPDGLIAALILAMRSAPSSEKAGPVVSSNAAVATTNRVLPACNIIKSSFGLAPACFIPASYRWHPPNVHVVIAGDSLVKPPCMRRHTFSAPDVSSRLRRDGQSASGQVSHD